MDELLEELKKTEGLAYNLHNDIYSEEEILDMIDDPQLSLFNEWIG